MRRRTAAWSEENRSVQRNLPDVIRQTQVKRLVTNVPVQYGKHHETSFYNVICDFTCITCAGGSVYEL